MHSLSQHIQPLLDYIVFLIEKVGYFGIFFGMFLESTFIPVPSEIIMIPAGIAAAYGKFNINLVILCGILGSLSGAIFNYALAAYFGRRILFKIGKLFFVNEKTIRAIERFFLRHGSFSTFTARLIPGVRQYISLPAGVAKMHFGRFCLYTTLGSSIWVIILSYLGMLIGHNKELVAEYLHITVLLCLGFCAILLLIYLWFVKDAKKS